MTWGTTAVRISGLGTGILFRTSLLSSLSVFCKRVAYGGARPSMGLGGTDGKGSNGGVWEWTSTAFATHEGLVPTQLFTGCVLSPALALYARLTKIFRYSTDFFDGVHHVAVCTFFPPRCATWC